MAPALGVLESVLRAEASAVGTTLPSATLVEVGDSGLPVAGSVCMRSGTRSRCFFFFHSFVCWPMPIALASVSSLDQAVTLVD